VLASVVSLVVACSLVATACVEDGSETTATTTPATTGPMPTTVPERTTLNPPSTRPAPTTRPPPEIPTELAGLRVVDEGTFEVRLTVPDPEFRLRLASVAFLPLPDEFFADPAVFEENPVGNGPFMMEGEWEHDARVALKRFEEYPGPDLPQIERLVFTIFPDRGTAFREVAAGNVDVMSGIPVDLLAAAQADFGDGTDDDRFEQFGNSSLNYLAFPTYLPEYTRRVRRALSMAVDRQSITDTIYLGFYEPAYSVIPPNVAGARPGPGAVCENWDHDPETARELWDAAGFDGDIVVWLNSGSGHDAWIGALVEQWGENLGIDPDKVRFEETSYARHLNRLDDQEIDGPFRLGWSVEYPSPYGFLDPLFHSRHVPPDGWNKTLYDNPSFDVLVEQGAAAVAGGGLEDGIPFYRQAEDVLCEDAQVLPVLFGKTQFVWSPGVENVVFDPFGVLAYSAVTSDDGTVTVGITEPEHLAPTMSNEPGGIAVARALFAPLVGYDAGTGEPYDLVAESVTTDDGGETWTIVLNDGFAFHNGDPVTARSFVDAWNYGAFGPNGQQNNGFYSNIVGYGPMNPDPGGQQG
jgi:ABC-type transport system substrate-binding protein